MNTPFFSIITPCLNAGEKLNGTLDSVLAQTFQDFEILVKDGGSDDGSPEGMRRDRRIRLIRAKDAGIYDAMNQAISSANGEYLLFLNCGDVLHGEKVLEQVEREIEAHRGGAGEPAFDASSASDSPAFSGRTGKKAGTGTAKKGDLSPSQQPAGCIFYGDVVERQTGQQVAANPHMTHLAMYRNLPCHQACFYSRDLFLERGFDLQYLVRADYEHFLWCVLRKGAGTVRVPVVITDYEGGGFSETPENREVSAREHERITAEYFSEKELRFFRFYMLVTLQPLREKLSRSPKTAALYDGIKNRIYRRQ